MKGINFKVIPHEKQRYPTAGDWWIGKGDIWQIRVSSMKNWRYEFLVFFHEVFEMAWCVFTGVSPKKVDAFDKKYEKNRKEGDLSEPGDSPLAPYHTAHQMATAVEITAAIFLLVDWQHYCRVIEKL